MNIAPCKGCMPPERHLGCHQECEKYISWKKNLDDENARKHEDAMIRNTVFEGSTRRNKLASVYKPGSKTRRRTAEENNRKNNQ